MDGAVNATAATQTGVGGIHDGVGGNLRDVRLDQTQRDTVAD
jgi:hypothetical protein